MATKTSPSILLVGGSGFVSGALARQAVAQGWQVWAVTRGQRALPAGVTPLTADRRDPAAFEAAVTGAVRAWDLVVECIGYDPADARQDVDVFRGRAGHFVFISTDFVYDAAHRRYPQSEETDDYHGEGYGLKKRQCEQVLIESDSAMPWTVVRPCHVYGPGSLLGSMPLHRRDARLIERMRAGETLRLAAGGRFLHHPIFADDLARVVLGLAGNQQAFGQIFNAAGPDLVETAEYYRIVGRCLGVEPQIEEVSVSDVLAAHPEEALSCLNRYYDLSKLRALGTYLPDTPLEDGLRAHVASLLG